MIFGGIFGFIYEEFFYKIDLGYFVKRGSTYGPWIPVYAFGALFICLFLYRFKKKPLFVMLFSCVITAITEYLTGFYFHRFRGIRLWDYNVERWNFGNINGYVCLRSVLLFTFASVASIYLVIPMFIKLAKKMNKKLLCFISFSLIIIFILDIIIWGIKH
jgi:uncharacterized membrane protein